MKTKTKPTGRTIYVPTESFSVDVDGVPSIFKRDVTRVREGHPILETHGHMFEEIRVEYEWESATAAPGEVRA